jgi:hypothetical protein
VFLPFETNFDMVVVATFFLALSAMLNNPEVREITINHLKEEIYNV